MKKRSYKVLPALAVSLAMLGGVMGDASVSYAAESTEVQTIQSSETQGISTAAVFDEDKFKLPDQAEIEANKKLKEVMEQWQESDEYPDYFATCVFLDSDFLYPVIQLTDVSEETKKDFLDRVGFKHEKWQFLEVSYSRKELLEFMTRVEADFGSDKRVEQIMLPPIVQVQGGWFYVFSEEARTQLEYRPGAEEADPLKIRIMPHNECEAEVAEDVKNTYTGEDADKVKVGINTDDTHGDVVTEDNLLPGREYRRQYRIHDFRDYKEYDTDYTSIVGDANGNEKIDLEDVQLMLKEALKIYDVYQFSSFFYFRFSEDHQGVNLSDVQKILKQALKIDKEVYYTEFIDAIPLYDCLETDRMDKTVSNKVLKGKEELMKYVDTLDNPELEKYLEGISDQYLEGKTFLVKETPVYSNELKDVGNAMGISYAIKNLPEGNVLLSETQDQNDWICESKDCYYTTISVVRSHEEDIQQSMTFTNELSDIYTDWGQTYNPQQDIKEGQYVIKTMEELENFNKNIGNGFTIKKDKDYFDYGLLVVNVTDYSGYTGDCDYHQITMGYEETEPDTFEVKSLNVAREKYLQHKQSESKDHKGNYVDVIELNKAVVFEENATSDQQENYKILFENNIKYTYIDFAPEQQSFVTDYSKSNKLMEGQVRITNEDEKAEVLNFLKTTFADASLIEAVEKTDVTNKEYVIAFTGNKGNAKTTQETEQMYVTFSMDSIEAYFNMDGTSFEPGKQVVTLMTFDKGTIRTQLEGNSFLQSSK